MKKLVAAALAASMPICAAEAQSMPAHIFLAKAEGLKKKGALALFSGDLKLLKKEIEGSAQSLRAERLAAEKAGRKPAYCPPAEQGGLAPDEIIGHFRSIPAAQRERMTVRDAFKALMVKKYPCPA